ncbi:MAG: biotin--[acetyl-CoA-carboxylase] ligase, partial [Pseudomonadota bacterium]|nr:biotin--[acetyl-CoA-carboxylase] ligase [Pseudomonadota bacterium]
MLSQAELIREAIAPILPAFTVEVLPQLDSTNSELMRRFKGAPGRPPQPEPLLLVAEQQSAGRGRLGRIWQSRGGDSLTFSLGLMLAPADWSGLSVAVGVSLADALHPRIQLKWPNDLWLDDRKLGGILIETAGTGEGPSTARYAVVGVGINVVRRQIQGLSTPPAALQELLPAIDAGQALGRVVQPLVQTLLVFQNFGFAPFQARFNARDALRERRVVLSDGSVGT